ncbi:MAG: phage portal protein [Prevotella sp.]|nr:phage portal protein [Prevotella sp.]
MINSSIEVDIDRSEPGLMWFINQIGSSEHIYRQAQVKKIHNHLLRQHKVLERESNQYNFKGKVFKPAAILLQGMKTVVAFHTAFLVGNPVSITGTPNAVGLMNRYYRKGLYAKVDWKILNDIITYGNAFEYVYLDENGVIKSKVFRNTDAYPIYDDNYEYRYFVEYWKNKADGNRHYVIYYPDHVDTYVNYKLIDSKPNLTGLPIHYVAMDKSLYDQFGDSMLLDLIPIQDKVEGLLSKLDDAVTTLSLNPIGVLSGAKIGEQDMIDSNIAGAVLNLEEGGEFNYANAEMDYNCIKYELDQLYQQFNLVAAIPSSMLGQSNIANVSENTTSIIYQLTENKGKQNMNSLLEGFYQRWQLMRKLMKINGDVMTDDDFESLDVSFNTNKPVDTKNNMENMQIQAELGAISKRTIMEQSPYTTDTAQELERLQAENGVSDVFADDEE